MSNKVSAELKEVFNALREQGWQVELTSNSHWRCRPPQKELPIVYTSSTTGGGNRALANFMAQLKRSGFKWAFASKW